MELAMSRIPAEVCGRLTIIGDSKKLEVVVSSDSAALETEDSLERVTAWASFWRVGD